MILQALSHSYEALAQRGELDRPGWLKVRISWVLNIDKDGKLYSITPLGGVDEQGKKNVRIMAVPEMAKRTSGIAPNFLCDNAIYMLGINSKGKKERAVACFDASAQLHINLLHNVNHPLAKAICNFFRTWNAMSAETHPLIVPILDLIKAGGNVVFSMSGAYAHEVCEIQDAWDHAYANESGTSIGRCLVTGEEGPITLVHPNIQGVVGAQVTGAALVSFHGDAYESHGHRKSQGLNAPISERIAFAYSACLNYMLREQAYHLCLGNTTMVFWAEDAQKMYSILMAYLLGVTRSEIDQNVLHNAAEGVRNGFAVTLDGVQLQPDQRFYVLGLTPNASRVAVQFFVENNFQTIVENLYRHQKRVEITRFGSDPRQELTLWSLLDETIRKDADEMPHTNLVGDVMRSILTNSSYPVTLFYQAEMCLRAEQTVLREKAAIIKAYLIKNVVRDCTTHPLAEILTVGLNESADYAPCVLGRLFAILEFLRKRAIPRSKTNTYERYFTLACATPALFFPQMIAHMQSQMDRLDDDTRNYCDKLITNLSERLGNSFPQQLSLEDQGAFQLGYYHQRVVLCAKEDV